MKPKHRLCLILLFALSYRAFAQNDSTRKTDSFISIGFGAAFPAGLFASTHIAGLGGYATAARCSYLSGGFIIKKWKFGFAIKEGWYRCGYNTGKYLKTLQANDTTPGATYTQYGGGSYYSGGYGMIGLITGIKLHRFNIGFRLLGGRITAVFPEVSYFVSSPDTTPVLNDFASTTVSVFAVEAGFNLRYSFSRHFCALVDAGLLYSHFIYSTNVQVTYSNGSSTSQDVTYNSTVAIINTYAGIAYTF